MRLPLALVAVLVLAGCGGSGTADSERKLPPLTLAKSQPPSAAVRGLVRAAGAGNAAAVRRLVAGTPAPAALVSLQRRLAGFERAGYEVVLEETVTSRLAVVAIAHGDAAFAAALRLDEDQWKMLLAEKVRIRAVRPQPAEVVRRRTQLAAEVTGTATAPLDEAGLWFDGVAFASRGGGTGPTNLTMFGEAPQPLTEGWHVVIAFASAGREAAALAWTFFVDVAGS